MMISKRLILLSQLILCAFLAACTPPAPLEPVTDFDVLFQTATLSALNAGDFEGEMWIATLLHHGDFGLGTFNALDGEMVILDGIAYQIRDDGVAHLAENSTQTPFAAVTFFEADQSLVVQAGETCADLQAQIDEQLPRLDVPYAVKVSGEFIELKLRAPHKQSAPYRTLTEALADQVIFDMQGISGTLVGFRLPEYMAGANSAGYHFHFISDDKQQGGHVLDCLAGTVTVQLDATERVHIDVTPAEADPMADAIPVGALLPLSGPHAAMGYDLLHAAYMAQDEVNNSGGINGTFINLVRADTISTEGSEADGAGAAAAQAFIDAEVVALIGSLSDDLEYVTPIINAHQIPLISPSAGTFVWSPTPYFYRTVATDAEGGRALALAMSYDADVLGGEYENVVLMVMEEAAFQAFQAPLQDTLRILDGELAATVTLAPLAPSYVEVTQDALTLAPDLIILIANPDVSLKVMQAANAAGYGGRWFLTQEQTTADFVQLAGPEMVEGSFGLRAIPAPESPTELARFTDLYTQINGHPPQGFVTNAYDAVTVLALAMLRADIHDWEVTRASVNANLPLVANPGEGKVTVTSYLEGKEVLMAGGEVNYQGISGPVDFDDAGNVLQPYGIFQVQEGAWVQLAAVDINLLQLLDVK